MVSHASRVSTVTEAVRAPRPGAEGQDAPDERKKVHRAETKTKTPIEAKRQGPTLDDVRKDPKVRVYIRAANQQTGAIGYTEHGERHAQTSADGARFILKALGHEPRRCELAAIAAYLHDMGNAVTRDRHGQTGALLAKDILEDLGFITEEVATVIYAVQTLKKERSPHEVSEQDLFNYILDWKKLWKKDEEKRGSVAEAIRNLEMLGWVKLRYSESLPVPA